MKFRYLLGGLILIFAPLQVFASRITPEFAVMVFGLTIGPVVIASAILSVLIFSIYKPRIQTRKLAILYLVASCAISCVIGFQLSLRITSSDLGWIVGGPVVIGVVFLILFFILFKLIFVKKPR